MDIKFYDEKMVLKTAFHVETPQEAREILECCNGYFIEGNAGLHSRAYLCAMVRFCKQTLRHLQIYKQEAKSIAKIMGVKPDYRLINERAQAIKTTLQILEG
jgi:hypothetical protein